MALQLWHLGLAVIGIIVYEIIKRRGESSTGNIGASGYTYG